MNKRLGYIDMAKGVGIILVLFGHLIYTNEYVRVWISSFHMPLFFVLSGITLAFGIKRKNKEDVTGTDTTAGRRVDVKTTIRKKFRSLIIPYMWFSLIYFIVDIGNLYLDKIDKNTFIVNAISSVTFYGKSVMWFLTALFLAQVIFILLYSRSNGHDMHVIIFVVILAAIAYPCSLGLRALFDSHVDSLLYTSLINILKIPVRAVIVLPFVAAGFYGHDLYNGVRRYADKKFVLAIAGITSLALNIAIAVNNWSVDTNNMILNDPILYYLGGLLGSLAIICLCAALPEIGALKLIGRYSLIIMAIHLDLYVLWAGLQVGEAVYSHIPYTQVLTTVTVICTLILSCIAGYIIERFFPFILGRKRKDKNGGV